VRLRVSVFGGKVSLPLLPTPIDPLKSISITSFDASKEDVEPGFMPTFKVQGQVYHLID